MPYITKIELGALGLLWCQGSQLEKAKFFYQLASKDGDDYI
jgi:hypothetical protein